MSRPRKAPDRVIHVYHVDDEPETVSWIPLALFTDFYADHPEWLDLGGRIPEDTDKASEMIIDLYSPDARVELHYHLLESDDGIPPMGGGDDALVILDLMRLENNRFLPVAKMTYDKLVEGGFPGDKVFFLTAFANMAKEHLGERVSENRLLTKPIDAGSAIPRLLRALGLLS